MYNIHYEMPLLDNVEQQICCLVNYLKDSIHLITCGVGHFKVQNFNVFAEQIAMNLIPIQSNVIVILCVVITINFEIPHLSKMLIVFFGILTDPGNQTVYKRHRLLRILGCFTRINV